MKEKLYNLVPDFVQNLMITLYNIKAYKIRYGGKYQEFRKHFAKNRSLSLEQLKDIQRERFSAFVRHSIANSEFYKDRFKDISNPENLDNISQLPVISKEDLRQNIDKVVIQTDEKLEKSKTGGTTGKSLEVKYRSINTQERFAMLDDFRNPFGYELGKKQLGFPARVY